MEVSSQLGEFCWWC